MEQSRRYQKVSGTSYNINSEYSEAADPISSTNLRSRRIDPFTDEEELYYQSLREKKSRVRAARARKAKARRRKKTAKALGIMLLISMAILFATGIHAFANNTPEEYVYYTTVTVEKGDTLWDLADDYVDTTDLTKKQYLNKICRMNGVLSDSIKPGDQITMFYYSTEIK